MREGSRLIMLLPQHITQQAEVGRSQVEIMDFLGKSLGLHVMKKRGVMLRCVQTHAPQQTMCATSKVFGSHRITRQGRRIRNFLQTWEYLDHRASHFARARSKPGFPGQMNETFSAIKLLGHAEIEDRGMNGALMKAWASWEEPSVSRVQVVLITTKQTSKYLAFTVWDRTVASRPIVESACWNSCLPGDFAERIACLFDTGSERVRIGSHLRCHTLFSLHRSSFLLRSCPERPLIKCEGHQYLTA